MVRIGPRNGLSSAVHIRPIGIDDVGLVRYVHARALGAGAMAGLTDAEIGAFAVYTQTLGYTDQLIDAVARRQLLGAWLDRELTGTVAWEQADDAGEAAGIDHLFVQPLFGGLGIGRRLMAEVERAARRAGCLEFSVRSVTPACGFFEKLGYRITARGRQPIGPGLTLPVTFLRKARLGEPGVRPSLH